MAAPSSPPAPPQFGDPAYWDQAYANLGASALPGPTRAPGGSDDEEDDEEDCFDWLEGWDGLGWLLEPMLARDPNQRVLHLGCGTSRLGEQFYDNGFPHQYSIDISAGAIEFMKRRNCSLRPEMQWLVGDVTQLPRELEAGTFDLIIEKSTLDALFCSDQSARDVACCLHEAHRLLSSGGVFLSVSMHTEKVMLRWLRHRAFGWRVKCVTIESKPEGRPTATSERPRRINKHYAYICTTNPTRREASGEAWKALHDRVASHPDDPISDCQDSSQESLGDSDEDA